MKRAMTALKIAHLIIAGASSASAAELGDLPLNAVVTDGIVQIGKHKYPLPPGEWRLIAKTTGQVSKVNRSGDGAEILSGYLINTKDKQFRAGMQISGTSASTSTTGWMDDPCKRDNVVFKDTLKGNFKFPECLIVNHYTGHLKPNNSGMNDAAHWVESNQIIVPQTTLAAVYDKYLYGDFVQIRFWINPELAEQTPSKTVNWVENDWHKDRIARDSAKALYLEKFVAWAKQLPRAYTMALDTDKTAANLPEFPDLKK